MEDKGGCNHSVFGDISVQKEKYYIIRIKKWLFGNRLLHLYTESYLPLAEKYIYLTLYTDICLSLAGKIYYNPVQEVSYLTVLKIEEHCARLLCKINLIVEI